MGVITMANLRFPKNLVNSELNPAFINFQYYSTKLGIPIPTTNIALAMPEDISQPSTISWDNEKFGMAGEGIKQAMKHGLAGEGVDSQTIESMTGALEARVKNAAIFNIAKTAGEAFGSGASAEGMMGAVSGKIANPYVTAIFRGVNFRNFDFVFRFTPLSQEDCVLIEQIISTMRAMALPDYTMNGSYLAYPYECRIDYFWKGRRNKWLNRFKRSACTKIDVNYTGTGSFSAMRNGFPTQIVLTTSWTELDIVVRGDIKDGY